MIMKEEIVKKGREKEWREQKRIEKKRENGREEEHIQ